jgi:hypothetical protein
MRPYAGKTGTFVGPLGRNDEDIIERLSGVPILEYTFETRESTESKRNKTKDETEIIDPLKPQQMQKYLHQ